MDDSITSIVSGKNKPPLGGTDSCKDDRIEVIGRYTLHAKIGVGGMASVCMGWISGAAEFSRVVAIKRMHPQFTFDELFAARFRDEAWLSSRLLHPNIVEVLDVVEQGQELLIVMEYVHGVSVAGLLFDALSAGCKLPPSVVAGILVPALHGLHAAHEATDDEGHPIGLVHRDFSPQNIMVSSEGQAKILDFGIARAQTHVHVTSAGMISGKFAYFSPEQALAGVMDRRADVFAAGIVLWEMLAGARLFGSPDITDAATLHRVLNHPVRPPSAVNPNVPSTLDDLVLHALERAPERRFASARAFALELEAAIDVASPSTVAEWIDRLCAKRLAALSRTLNRTRRRMRQAQLGVSAAPAVNPQSLAWESLPKAEEGTSVTVHAKALRRLGSRWPKMIAVATMLIAFSLVLSFRSRLFRFSSMASTVPATSPPASTPTFPPAFVALQPLDEVPAAVEAPRGASAQSADLQPQRSNARSGARAGKSRPPSTTRSLMAPRKSAARPNCDPPTYLDSDGIRIFKDECL
jgi:eukaryotic-like serine/threonine-protein kinase